MVVSRKIKKMERGVGGGGIKLGVRSEREVLVVVLCQIIRQQP